MSADGGTGRHYTPPPPAGDSSVGGVYSELSPPWVAPLTRSLAVGGLPGEGPGREITNRSERNALKQTIIDEREGRKSGNRVRSDGMLPFDLTHVPQCQHRCFLCWEYLLMLHSFHGDHDALQSQRQY